MSWQLGKYYYRSVWTHSGPRNVYVGHGLIAHLAEQLDAQRAATVAIEAAQRRRERRQERELDAELDGHYGELRTHVHARLVAAGWYSHKREWRRYNFEGDLMTEALTTDLATITHTELNDLVARCNVAKPKSTDLAALRKVMSSTAGAHVTLLSGTTLAQVIIGGDGALKIVTDAELNRLRYDLGADDCPPVERSLIDHIVTCWARLQVAERRLTSATCDVHEPSHGIYWERRVTEAQRRYLRALGLLARMRALTSVQVNIATNQQVNNG